MATTLTQIKKPEEALAYADIKDDNNKVYTSDDKLPKGCKAFIKGTSLEQFSDENREAFKKEVTIKMQEIDKRFVWRSFFDKTSPQGARNVGFFYTIPDIV